MPQLKITPSFIIWLSALIILKTPYLAPMALAVLIHETGHLIFARILKIKISTLTLSLLGARIKAEGHMSYSDEFLLALGGPLAGFIGYLLTVGISVKLSDSPAVVRFIAPFCAISLCLTIFNLLPLETLDGGRMLSSLLHCILPLNIADFITSLTGFLVILSLWLLSVYIIIKSSGGVPMLLFCSFFFAKQFIFRKNDIDFTSF